MVIAKNPGVIIFLVMVIPFSVFAILHPERHYEFRTPDLVAPSYIWPKGCKSQNYKEDDKISRSCLVKQYEFKDAYEYGLPTARGTNSYYRLGNNADLIVCGFWKYCEVRWVVEKAFHQPTGTAALKHSE